jgi:hypothetical protein
VLYGRRGASSSPLQYNNSCSEAGLGNATPDQVGNDRDPSEHVFDGRLEWDMNGFLPLADVLTGVAREARKEAEA